MTEIKILKQKDSFSTLKLLLEQPRSTRELRELKVPLQETKKISIKCPQCKKTNFKDYERFKELERHIKREGKLSKYDPRCYCGKRLVKRKGKKILSEYETVIVKEHSVSTKQSWSGHIPPKELKDLHLIKKAGDLWHVDFEGLWNLIPFRPQPRKQISNLSKDLALSNLNKILTIYILGKPEYYPFHQTLIDFTKEMGVKGEINGMLMRFRGLNTQFKPSESLTVEDLNLLQKLAISCWTCVYYSDYFKTQHLGLPLKMLIAHDVFGTADIKNYEQICYDESYSPVIYSDVDNAQFIVKTLRDKYLHQYYD